MGKKRIFLKLSVFSLFLVVALLLCSCTKGNGRANLSEFLASEYTAEVEYSLEGKNGTISGEAHISSNEGVQITFSSPDVFEGMTVENTPGGELGNIYFSYYGMRLPLPDKSLQKVSLMLSLFSGNMQTSLATLGRGAFEDAKPEDLEGIQTENIATAKKCTFSIEGNTECTVLYDPVSGMPYRICADNGDNCASVTFLKIKNQ